MIPGSRFASYEIVARLGAGGMGEVYLARDVRLGRDVALKLLPARFASDPARLSRFEREARLLAALNHPNIATIYGIDERDGRAVLVLEYVEGETLRDRLDRSPVPLAEVLAVCVQVAAGLAAAHEAGVIHRDVKPDNIRIRPDGSVKLLDFGLAKMLAPASDDAREDPTLTHDPTIGDAVLGTPGYLSPEQARGQAVDRRADTWGFGCILYELLTGSPPFPGETSGDRLAAVLKDEPDWSLLPESTPATVRDVLRSSLEKDPEKRLRDLVDARLLLDAARATDPPPGRRRKVLGAAGRAAVAAIALACAAGLGALARQSTLAAPVAAETRYLAIALPGPPSVDLGASLDISADGSRVVLFGSVCDLGSPGLRRLETGPYPFLSPDGKWIGGFPGGLAKIAGTGGTSVRLMVHDAPPAGGCWLADDTILHASDLAGPISRIPAMGGRSEAVTRLDLERGEVSHRWPHPLPDGRGFVYTVKTVGLATFDDADIRVHDLATGEDHVLLTGGSDARVTASNHILFGRRGTLMAAAFDPARLVMRGAPVSVLRGMVTNPSTGVAQYAVSRAGDLVYVSGSPFEDLSRLIWLDSQGRTREALPRMSLQQARLSPNGRQVAIVRYGANDKIWLGDLDEGWTRQITFGGGNDHDVAWARDGRRLVFLSDRGAVPAMDSIDLTETAPETRLGEMSDGIRGDLTTDAEGVLYTPATGDRASEIWLMPWDRAKQPRLVGRRPTTVAGATLSPDGHWLAYTNQLGDLHVDSFPGPGPAVMLRDHHVMSVKWDQTGTSIAFTSDEGASSPVYTVTFDAGPAPRLGEARLVTNRSDLKFVGARDGIMLFQEREPVPTPQLHLVTGFFAVLDREVPVEGD